MRRAWVIGALGWGCALAYGCGSSDESAIDPPPADAAPNDASPDSLSESDASPEGDSGAASDSSSDSGAILGTSYYVDCMGGNDSQDGKSAGAAWKTIARANQALEAGGIILAGDAVLLKAGCTFSNVTLEIHRSGTSAMPITIASYGTGSKPVLMEGTTATGGTRRFGVFVDGSYIALRGLHATFDVTKMPTSSVSGCDQPLGYYVGFQIGLVDTTNTHHVDIADCEASFATVGIKLQEGAHHLTVRESYFHDNGIMQEHGTPNAWDLGAWGMLLQADDSLIVGNLLRNNNSKCLLPLGAPTRFGGNAIELYNANRNLIYRNRAEQDRVFSELGRKQEAGKTCDDNVFAYNVHISTVAAARFVTTRGNGHPFGPVYGTRLLNNTVLLTDMSNSSTGIGSGSPCEAGVNCDPKEIVIAYNNILSVSGSAMTVSSRVSESNNLFWDPTYQVPAVSITGGMHASDIKGDPKFVAADAGDVRLGAGSPGENSGMLLTVPYLTTSLVDIAGNAVSSPPERGATER